MGGGRFSQREAADYLKQCSTEREVGECLSAYIYQKFRKGHGAPMVARKLQLLGIYLHAVDGGHMYQDYQPLWNALYREVLIYGGGAIGATAATTDVGKQIWNLVRRGERRDAKSKDANNHRISVRIFRTNSSTNVREPAPMIPVMAGAAANETDEIDENWGNAGPGAVLQLVRWRSWASTRSTAPVVKKQPPGYIAPVDPREGLPHYGA